MLHKTLPCYSAQALHLKCSVAARFRRTICSHRYLELIRINLVFSIDDFVVYNYNIHVLGGVSGEELEDSTVVLSSSKTLTGESAFLKLELHWMHLLPFIQHAMHNVLIIIIVKQFF